MTYEEIIKRLDEIASKYVVGLVVNDLIELIRDLKSFAVKENQKLEYKKKVKAIRNFWGNCEEARDEIKTLRMEMKDELKKKKNQ